MSFYKIYPRSKELFYNIFCLYSILHVFTYVFVALDLVIEYWYSVATISSVALRLYCMFETKLAMLAQVIIFVRITSLKQVRIIRTLDQSVLWEMLTTEKPPKAWSALCTWGENPTLFNFYWFPMGRLRNKSLQLIFVTFDNSVLMKPIVMSFVHFIEKKSARSF